MVIFIYIGNSEDMLVKKFGFSQADASLWYATPYIISAFASPVLGIVIDKVGRRALFICASSKNLYDRWYKIIGKTCSIAQRIMN